MVRGAVFLSIMLGLLASMFMKKAEVEGSQKALNQAVKSIDPEAKNVDNIQDAEKQIQKSLEKIMNNRYENLGH